MNDPDFDPYLPPRAPVGLANAKGVRAEVPMGNPWLTIWTKPRGTIRGIVETDPGRSVILLGVLSGILRAIDQAIGKDMGDKMPLSGILFTCLIGGAIAGLVMLYLFGALIRISGGWLGGRASGAEVRAALAWASVPQLMMVFVYAPAIAYFGQDLFRTINPDVMPAQSLGLGLIGLGLAQVVLGIWSFIVGLKTLGEVQGFSAWMALGNMILAVIIFLAILFGVVLGLFGLAFVMKGA